MKTNRIANKKTALVGLVAIAGIGTATLAVNNGLAASFTDSSTETVDAQTSAVDINFTSSLWPGLVNDELMTKHTDHLSNLAPGDVRYRILSVTNQGGTDLSSTTGYVTVSSSAAPEWREESYVTANGSIITERFGTKSLLVDSPPKLGMVIEQCSGTWNGSNGSTAKPTCSGTVTNLYTLNNANKNATAPGTTLAFRNNALKQGESINLLVTYQIDSSATIEHSGATAEVTYLVEATQRSAFVHSATE